jgi:hypothetical protein
MSITGVTSGPSYKGNQYVIAQGSADLVIAALTLDATATTAAIKRSNIILQRREEEKNAGLDFAGS